MWPVSNPNANVHSTTISHSEHLVDDPQILKRITADPLIFGGKPIVRGLRISVELILDLLAQGETEKSILADYPDLTPEDIRACLAYAHAIVAHDRIDAVQVAHR
jgi:uncharacterized protein (DUF433 family)